MDSRLYVRTSVRTDFVRNPHIRFFCFFSWSGGSINAKKWQFRFLAENSKLALFWPKMVQNWPFLAKTAQNQCFLLLFSKWRIRFFWFFPWSLGFTNVKKWLFYFFVENSKLALFWPKTTKIWPFLAKKLNFFKFWPNIDFNFFWYAIFYMKYF